MSANEVTVKVPGTTANLGSGFDTLGIALNLYNSIHLRRATGTGARITSGIAPDARPGATRMIQEAARLFFRRAGTPRFGIAVHLSGEVPVARGLGSSVTVRLGVVAGLNSLTGSKLDRHAMLQIVSDLEHHPDNAAPAIFGGFTAAGALDSGSVRCVHFPVSPKVAFVTLIPPFEVSTEAARRLVPQEFSKSDTVHSLNRSALITAAFARRDYSALKGLFDDRVHQPYREKLIPQLSSVIRAGEKAGAVGGWLSGSGSTIICLTLQSPEQVAEAMRQELPGAETRILRASNAGYSVRSPRA